VRQEDAQQQEGAELLVRACKYGGRVHREWPARLMRREATLLIVEGAFAHEVRHPQLGLIVPGTHSTEYYWTDRWYSIFRFREPSGELRNYYCNVNQPAQFDGRVLSYVDLDIDVLIAPDFSYSILDEDEFATHALSLNYSTELQQQARTGLRELLSLIEARRFPFDEVAG